MSDVSYILVAEDVHQGGFVAFLVCQGELWDGAALRSRRPGAAAQRIIRYSELVAMGQSAGTMDFRGSFKYLPGYSGDR